MDTSFVSTRGKQQPPCQAETIDKAGVLDLAKDLRSENPAGRGRTFHREASSVRTNPCHPAGWACPTGLLSFSAALIESRIGRTTNSAIATTMKFMTAATVNTAYQLPV